MTQIEVDVGIVAQDGFLVFDILEHRISSNVINLFQSILQEQVGLGAKHLINEETIRQGLLPPPFWKQKKVLLKFLLSDVLRMIKDLKIHGEDYNENEDENVIGRSRGCAGG